jgi:ribulose 1,5-bisphosphate synthetase/thiazole synthase
MTGFGLNPKGGPQVDWCRAIDRGISLLLTSDESSKGGMPVADLDVVVVGAGFARNYAVHALRSSGLSVRAFEVGGGIGGS